MRYDDRPQRDPATLAAFERAVSGAQVTTILYEDYGAPVRIVAPM